MEAPPSKTYTLLTSVHNDVDDADNADNIDDYNRVIAISKCEQNFANTHPNLHTHPQTSKLGDYNKLSLWLSFIITRKPMGLKCSPLKTSFLAAVQV